MAALLYGIIQYRDCLNGPLSFIAFIATQNSFVLRTARLLQMNVNIISKMW
jgi:hypothetical protein